MIEALDVIALDAALAQRKVSMRAATTHGDGLAILRAVEGHRLVHDPAFHRLAGHFMGPRRDEPLGGGGGEVFGGGGQGPVPFPHWRRPRGDSWRTSRVALS